MLTKIEAVNFKCLRALSCPLRPFQLMVGPNASGKSTFLDALAFLSDMLREDLESAIRRRAGSFRELVWQGSEDRFKLAVELGVPKDLWSAKNGEPLTHCRYEVAVQVHPTEGGIHIAAENLFLIRRRKTVKTQPLQLTLFPSEPALPSPLVLEMGKRTPAGWRKVISRTPEGRAYYRSETSHWNFPMGLARSKPALAVVPEEERFAVTNWAKQALMAGIHLLALNSRAMREASAPDAPRSYLPDGSNLPIVVRDLVKPRSAPFKRWVAHIQTVLPNLTGIAVEERESDRHPYLRAQFGQHLRVPSWLLSDGTLRMLALTLLAYLPPEHQQVYLIEEPENGVHPKALEAVYQSLSSVYDGQVLLATHSPVLLGLAEVEDILCFAQAESGATVVVRGPEHPALRDWRGETPLETLYAAGVLG